MTAQAEIQQEEQELQALLQTVMKGPLQPIVNSIEQINGRLTQVECQIEEMRGVEIGALCLRAEDILKQIRGLKSLTEDTPGATHRLIHSPLEQLKFVVEQQTQILQPHFVDLFEQLLTATSSADQQFNKFVALVENASIRLQNHVSECAGQNNSAYNLVISQLAGQLETKLNDLRGQLSDDIENSQKAISGIRESLTNYFSELKKLSSAGTEKVILQAQTGLSDLEKHVAHFQVSDAQLAEQISILKQRQEAVGVVLRQELTMALKPIQKWLFVTALVATTALGGIAVFAFGKFL